MAMKAGASPVAVRMQAEISSTLPRAGAQLTSLLSCAIATALVLRGDHARSTPTKNMVFIARGANIK